MELEKVNKLFGLPLERLLLGWELSGLPAAERPHIVV